MGFMSTVVGYLLDKYRGGSKNVGISKITAKGNPYTSQLCFGPGIEINPADGERLVIMKIDGSESYMVAIAGTNQNIEPGTARGERKIYSVSEDGSEIKAIAKFKNDGVLELNGASDSAVLFSELKAGFDQLVSDFNGHIHTTTATIGSSGTPGVISPPTALSAAEIDGSESADIKIS